MCLKAGGGMFETKKRNMKTDDVENIHELDLGRLGNPMPLGVLCFFAAALFLGFGLFLLLSDIYIDSSGIIKSQIVSKIIVFAVMLLIALLMLLLGRSCVKGTKKYYREKAKMENEESDTTVEDEIAQRICPNCGKSHDIDYPKCPHCKYSYLE